jgi:hypothetical protein
LKFKQTTQLGLEPIRRDITKTLFSGNHPDPVVHEAKISLPAGRCGDVIHHLQKSEYAET